MTAQTANKATVPVGSDGWNLTTHIKQAIETTRSIIPVASKAERDGLAALFPGSVLPITTHVWRSDIRVIETWDGVRWHPQPNIVGYLSVSATSPGFSSGEWFVDQINNVSMVAGHKYELTYKFNHLFATGADVPFVMTFETSLTSDSGTTGAGWTGSSTTFWSAPVSNSGKTDTATATYVCTGDETKRFSVVTGRLSGSSLYDISGRTFTIKDLGYLA